jgi:hypothetical protein
MLDDARCWRLAEMRKRRGMRHHPLAELLNAFISAGLATEEITEAGGRPVPAVLGIRPRKSGQ